ncbi:MAG TPA: ADP-ribosylglycohydrolase family protein [Nitrospira sp.]|nr:ADP-ribosylglycohydrolase family protein [Nitrospira sp.]
MLGAIAGDVIGSVYESQPIKSTEFPLFSVRSTFTDDTVLTVAIAYSILRKQDYATSLKQFARRYPHAGYGGEFYRWAMSPQTGPYMSWGNGSAMRVSPVGFASQSIQDVLSEAEKTAEVTHNHPEGIKGAQAVALAVFLARQGEGKVSIKRELQKRFGYELDRTLDDIRPAYRFNGSCQGSVPESIIAFLESTDYEDAVRKAVSLGGDSDTMACIAGGIAHAYYKHIATDLVTSVKGRLPEEFLEILDEFEASHAI